MKELIDGIFNKFDNIDEKLINIQQKILLTYNNILNLCTYIIQNNKDNQEISLIYRLYYIFTNCILYLIDARTMIIQAQINNLAQTGGKNPYDTTNSDINSDLYNKLTDINGNIESVDIDQILKIYDNTSCSCCSFFFL